jgi:hypothetical protein
MCELVLVQQCVQQPGCMAARIGAFTGDLSPPIRVRTACQCMGMHDYCQNPVFRSEGSSVRSPSSCLSMQALSY